MSQLNNNYQLLIRKLDEFIRKFYVNKLIRGSLYFVGVVLASFIVINVLEHYFYFSSGVRQSFFFGFIGLSLLSFVYWVFMPLLNYFKLGKVISHTQAASIIGDHFTNVEDKLLNILQLKEQASKVSDASLIEASIDQKIDTLKPVPFKSAINLSKNREYAKYALIPLLFLGVLLLAFPKMITGSTERITQYNTEFEKAAPFKFELTTENLEVVQYEDLDIQVKVDGEILPNDAYIKVNDFPYKLNKEDANNFNYRFNKVQKEVEFYFEADGFQSKKYKVNVIPKPAIIGFELALDYPAYTGKKDETLKNTGDLLIPIGSKVDWKFDAQHTDDIQLKFSAKDSMISAQRQGEDLFAYGERVYKEQSYTIYVSNDKLHHADSISYGITIVPDLYPTISAEQFADSTDAKLLYFTGETMDDYGISDLKFVYNVDSETSPNKGRNTTPIKKGLNPKATSFTHYLDVNTLELDPGDKLTYYFEVWDNDGVSGKKFARTQTFDFKLPSYDELEQIAEDNTDELQDDLEESVDEMDKLQEELNEMKERLLQKKDMEWEDKQMMENMIEKQKEMNKQMEQMKQNFQQNFQKQQEFKQFTPSLEEKYNKMQEMFDEMMTDEMKEMYEKLEEMMEEAKMEDVMEYLEEMELTEEQMQEEMERLKELLKQLEYEQKMTDTIEKLEELAEEQEELAEETEEKDGGDMTEEEKKQEELNKEMEEVMEDIAELEEMNEEINEEENSMDEMQEQGEDAQEDQQESMEEMEKQDSQKASEKQKEASEKMQEMAQKMQQQMMDQQQQQQEEDMQAIRQLLENLIRLSLDQEDVMDQIIETSVNNPKYVEHLQQQYKLKDDAQLVEDSLVALSKRVFEIETYVMKELTELKRNMDEGLELLEERKADKGTVSQQYVMTSLNNLALMLSEVMQQMQQQMAQQMDGDQNCSGNGSCDKPGGKGQGSISKMQQQLNDKMSKAAQSTGGKKPGKGQMSKEMAQMAAEQAAIREAIKEMNREGNKDGTGSMGDLEKLMEEMEETEEDLVNKRLTTEMMQRQQDIMTKLLEAEKAQREREWDDKRQSQTARNIEPKIPPSIEEYLKKREAEVELYKTLPPSLKPYYKSLVEKYFKAISF